VLTRTERQPSACGDRPEDRRWCDVSAGRECCRRGPKATCLFASLVIIRAQPQTVENPEAGSQEHLPFFTKTLPAEGLQLL